MLLYPSAATVPSGLRTAAFVLQPLSPVHNPLDYEAAMATQARLRLCARGEWPRLYFTPEENLLDLEGHAADFQARTGFTYTVLAPTETLCLGCVYVYPLDEAYTVSAPTLTPLPNSVITLPRSGSGPVPITSP